jgi:hypothetical protein
MVNQEFMMDRITDIDELPFIVVERIQEQIREIWIAYLLALSYLRIMALHIEDIM